MTHIVFLISALTFFSVPAIARDDGGFGSSFTGAAPSGFEQPAPSVLAKYSDSSVAEIEPAAGDDLTTLPADQEIGKQSATPETPEVLQPPSVLKPETAPSR